MTVRITSEQIVDAEHDLVRDHERDLAALSDRLLS